MKIVKKIKLKIVIFTAVKYRCIMHGRIFVMQSGHAGSAQTVVANDCSAIIHAIKIWYRQEFINPAHAMHLHIQDNLKQKNCIFKIFIEKTG